MNKMCIIGNLTKDPELRSTSSGVSVCSFTVAVNRRKRGTNGEELPAMFYRVTTWRQLAENCGKFLRKASKVYVDGDLSISTYQGNDGETRFSLEIDSQNVEFLSGIQGNNSEHNATPIVVHTVENNQENQQKYTEVQVSEDNLPF